MTASGPDSCGSSSGSPAPMRRAQIEAMRTFGAIGPDVDVEPLVARMLRRRIERIDERDHGAITFERLGNVLGRLLGILGGAGVTMPKDLVLFFKNLLYLSGFAARWRPMPTCSR